MGTISSGGSRATTSGERQHALKRIARIAGFRDEQALRRAFIQQMSVTPKEYRERFGVAEAVNG